MAITREDVLHVAALAQLDLSEDEIGRLTEQLDVARPSLLLDDAFANAPERDGDLFRVPPTGAAEESSA